MIQGGTRALCQQAQAHLDFFGEHFLLQIIEEPTRSTNILDLFAVNDDHLILRYQVMSKSKISDHNVVLITTTQYLTPETHTTPILEPLFTLNFWSKSIDWSVIGAKFASINWETQLTNTDPEETLEKIISVIKEICIETIPKKKLNKNDIPRDRKTLMRRRNKLNKKLRCRRTDAQKKSIMTELLNIDSKIIASHEAELRNKENRAIIKISGDKIFFYKYAKSKSAARSPVGPLQAEGELIAEPSRMCELLKNQFESVFSVPQNTANIEALCNEAGPRCMEDLCFDEEDIAQAIKCVPTHSSLGPDGIPAKLLKECTDELKKPIFMLWRSSLNLGRVPHKLKRSHVIPIFKKGNRSSPQNYRPISLVSHLSKIFERVVVKNLTSYLNDLNLFNQHQHGFRSGRSCLSQL